MAEGYTSKVPSRLVRQNPNTRRNLLSEIDGFVPSSMSTESTARNFRSFRNTGAELVDPLGDFTPVLRPLCRFFKKGNCQYGERCRYAHCLSITKATETNGSTSASTSSTETLQWSQWPDSDLPHTITSGALLSEEWANAPEFVPLAKNQKAKSYAEILNPEVPDLDQSELKLCPLAEMTGSCNFPEGICNFLHGDICELCGNKALHPYNEEKRKLHTQECISRHERDMELSFAVARSKEKSCGVCFELIMEKTSREQRFGILPNCNHCFCLTCIRKWRQARQFDNKIIRACPECRVTSDFVCPSMYWVDTKEEKEKLITDYKGALSRKDCKYFKQGRGKCPFGNKCFYLHALPDGTKTDVGPPPRQPRRQNPDGEIDVLQQIILWDFLEDRENGWLYSLADDLEDLVAFFSDSDDSDWSEYDFFFD